MLIDRILPVEEWAKLKGTDLEPFLADATFKSRAQIIVVEDDGRIIGHLVWIKADHVEGAWIAPEHRGKATVARRLWTHVKKEIAKTGAKTCIVAADREDLKRMWIKRATPFPAQEFVVCLQQS